MITSTDPLKWLFGLEQFGIKLGLDNISAMLDALGHPEQAFHTIHIAGTNGKGSVTAMIDTALRAAGHRSARYTSPHLVDLAERFVINGRQVDRDALLEAVNDVRLLVDKMRSDGTLAVQPTFFETTTVIAFELFRRARVEVAVCEVGLGGRLDATNVLSPVVSAITSIGLDHQQHLGDTLESIAAEKAGIIKRGVPVVCGRMDARARATIRAHAGERDAPFVDAWDGVYAVRPDIFRVRPDATVTQITTRVRLRTAARDYGEIALALAGDHQIDNAVVAVRVLELVDARISVPTSAILHGLMHVSWPARLELRTLANGREVLLDAAHNADGAAALAAYLTSKPRVKRPLVFGTMRDKDAAAMLGSLVPAVSHVMATRAATPRSADPDEIAAIARGIAPAIPVTVHPSIPDALAAAWRESARITVAGSLYLIGDVMKELALTALLALAFVFAAAPARAQQTVAGWTLKGNSQVQIARGEWALVGDAEIVRGDVSIYADEIDYFEEENRAVASGNVLMSQGGNRIGADSANFDTKTMLGVFHTAYGIATVQPPRRNTVTAPGAFAAPQMTGQENDVYFFGDTIEKLGPKKYKITNGGFTTCLQPTPRWNMVGSTIVVNINHYTTLKNMVLNVKGVPLLYLPFMYYPTKEDDRATGFLIPTYGSSSLLGQSIHNAFFWAIDRSQDLTIQHEWFSKMGQGIGGNYRYNWGGGSDGDIQGFLLSPKDDASTNGFPSGKSFELRGSADQMLTPRLRARAQVNYFSDLDTHQLFNSDIYVAASNERSYSANVVGAFRNYSLTGNFSHYEDFYSPTSSLTRGTTPQISVRRSERPLFAGSPIYFTANGEYAHLVNETKAPDVDTNNSVNRLDFSPQLRYPFKKWPFLTVNSSVQFRDTFYTSSYDHPVVSGDLLPNPVVGQSLNRQFAVVQAQITGPVFARIFDTPSLGYAEKFKHTIEPTVTITRKTNIDDQLRLRIVNNDNVDYEVGGTTNVDYKLTNHLMAKRKLTPTGPAQSTEILTLSVSQSYYTNTNASQFDTAYQGTTSIAPSNFSPVLADLVVAPQLTTSGEVRAQFNSRTHNLDLLSVSGRYNFGTQVRTYTTWTKSYYQDPASNVRIESSNSLSLSTNLQTRDNRFGGTYSLLYDFFSSTLQQQTVSGFYNAQCCGFAMSYTHSPLSGIPGLTSNSRFFLSITLAGLGSVSPIGGGPGGPGFSGPR